MVDMKVNIAGVEWNNPVCVASGTFGFGREYGEYFDLNELGAISVKGLRLRNARAILRRALRRRRRES